MANRTPVNNGYARADERHESRPTLTEGVRNIGRDVFRLAELQFRLLLADAREALRRSLRFVFLILLSIAFVLGAIPVALVGLSEILIQEAGWPPAIAYLCVAGGALGLAGVGFYQAVRRIRASFTAFASSREELARNLKWIRNLLKS